MTYKSAKDLPPPTRKPKRRLSLKTAIAAASRPESKIVKPLMDPLGEFPSLKEGKKQEIEANLLELQADIIIREGLLSDKEQELQNRAREIDEKEALLEAHRKLLDSETPSGKKQDQQPNISNKEREALESLKRELNAQEESLKEARNMLQEREIFIESCENELVEKSMLLTEREARIEQREEDHEAKKFSDAKSEDDEQAG